MASILIRHRFGVPSRACETVFVPPSKESGGLVSGLDQRSPLSIGIGWASRISTLGFEFSLPPIAGHLVDRWLGSNPVGTLVGMIIGFLVGMIHLLQIAKGSSKQG
jgi:hypothetical protein